MADRETPRVVVVGLASCFGCQINLTNMEAHLLDLLGSVDMAYWQLTSSDPMPERFDVAVVEGAVTTDEAAEAVRAARREASTLIAIGACACTAGLPGLASDGVGRYARQVYGEAVPGACATLRDPAPVSAYVPVDFEVPCCPVDPAAFVAVLHRALYGSNGLVGTSTLCGECKRNERGCFFEGGTLCLGLITRGGCAARCPSLGRPCNGCAGLSADANLAAARAACADAGIEGARFDEALELFNKHALGREASATGAEGAERG